MNKLACRQMVSPRSLVPILEGSNPSTLIQEDNMRSSGIAMLLMCLFLVSGMAIAEGVSPFNSEGISMISQETTTAIFSGVLYNTEKESGEVLIVHSVISKPVVVSFYTILADTSLQVEIILLSGRTGIVDEKGAGLIYSGGT